MTTETKVLTMEEWDEKNQDERDEIAELHPEAVPEQVKSEIQGKLKKEEEISDDEILESEDKLVKALEGVKDNRGKDALQAFKMMKRLMSKENKGLKEQLDTVQETFENEIAKLKEPASNVNKGGTQTDALDKIIESIGSNGIEMNDAGEYQISKSWLKRFTNEIAMLSVNNNVFLRNMEKTKARDIKSAVKKLDKKDKELYGDDVSEELERIVDRAGIGAQITKEMVDDALNIARGKNTQKLVEDATKELQKKLKKEEPEVLGEEGITEEGGVPGKGKYVSSGGNRKPSMRQLRLARQKNISTEEQMASDDKHGFDPDTGEPKKKK